MGVCLCFSVFFLRLFYLCTANAIDLGLLYNSQASTLPPSALIECTPANCSKDSECSWKYCPVAGHVPKCVEGNYSDTCCMCTDEWPNILPMMMSSTCSHLHPIRFKKGYYDQLGGPPTKICHQLHDIQSKSNKLIQLYQKISNKRLKNMGIKKRSYLELQINRLHRKKLRLYQIGRNYDLLLKPTSSDGEATEDGGNDYISRNDENNVLNIDNHAMKNNYSNVLINSYNYMIKDYKGRLRTANDTKPKETKATTKKNHIVKNNVTASTSTEVMHRENDESKDLSDDNDEKQVIKGDNHIPEAQQKVYISKNYEPKVIMGDKLVG